MSVGKIETNTEKRWETGTPHHCKSENLARFIAKMDEKNDDIFDFRFGGDGDNGKHLMYLLDIFFETQDLEDERRNC